MDWWTFLRYACSIAGMVCLGFTYAYMIKSSKKKEEKVE